VDVEVDPVEPFCAPDGSVKVEFIVKTGVDPGLGVDGAPVNWDLTATVKDEDGNDIINTTCKLENITTTNTQGDRHRSQHGTATVTDDLPVCLLCLGS
jgi:hypothetical protein